MSHFDNTGATRGRSVEPHDRRGTDPEEYSTATPNLVVDGGAAALEFYERASGAEAVARPVSVHVHGDRAGSVRDPFGHRWAVATHVEDGSPEEIQRRMAELA